MFVFPRQRIRLHIRHHGCNRATAGGQRGTGTLHHGVNSDFYSFQMRHFACRKYNLLAIDGECHKHTHRAHVFLMSTLSAYLSQPVVAVVLQGTVILSHVDFTHTRGSSTTWSFAHCALPKIVTSHHATSYFTPHLSINYTYTWHVHSFPDTTYLTFLGSSSE